ncbi:nuclear transport factor 2 family protein [Spirosoma endbachense]|nr:nuclear transport factor 2 family protein [Spirosoma endbachense]
MNQILVLLMAASFILTSCKTSFSQKKTQAHMATEIDNSATSLTLDAVERFNAAFNRHDVDAVMNAMTEDCIFENTNPQPDGTRLVGADAVRAYWGKFFAANPDAIFETEEIFATGDRCVVRWIYRKTKEGKPWHLRGVDIFKVRNGKVAEKLAYVKG